MAIGADEKRAAALEHKAYLVKAIEAYVRGGRQQEISARELASIDGSRRLLTLRNGLLLAVYRAYHRKNGRSLPILPGLLVLISAFSDNDRDGVCTLGTERIATFLNTNRESVSRAIRQAKDAQLIRVEERSGSSLSNECILVMPRTLADHKLNMFDMLDALAPREERVLPHGRRRDGTAFRGSERASASGESSQISSASHFDTRDAGLTGEGNTRDAGDTAVVNSRDFGAVTGVTLGLHDLSSLHSSEEEEKDHSLAGQQDRSLFAGAPTKEKSDQEVALSPLPLSRDVGYATQVYATNGDTTHKARFDEVAQVVEPSCQLDGDIVRDFADCLVWLPTNVRTSETRPAPNLALARELLTNVLNKAKPAEIGMQALSEAVSSLKIKQADADAAVARDGQARDADIVKNPIAYLKTTFKNELRKMRRELRDDALSMRNAKFKADLEARADIAASEKKLAALDDRIKQNEVNQQKIADSRAARTGAARIGNGKSNACGVIEAEDGSMTFAPYTKVKTVHRTDIIGLDAITILNSFDGATVDDVLKALDRVVDRNKPHGKGDSNYFDPPSASAIVDLAKGYLPAIVLHRLHGPPEKYVDGPVAEVETTNGRRATILKTEFVAVSQSWLDALKNRLPDLAHVRNVSDALDVLGMPKEVISESQARTASSPISAVFRIAAHSASTQPRRYGPELTQQVASDMEAYLININKLGREKREQLEAEQQRVRSLASNACAPNRGSWADFDKARSESQVFEPTSTWRQ